MDQEEFSLEALRSSIKERGAEWEPEETTLSLLTPSERVQRLGLLPTNVELGVVTELGLDRPIEKQQTRRRPRKSSNPGAVGLPSKIDWRDYDGKNWTTPIRDQGACGSCVAFGTVAALEALLKIRTFKDAGRSVDLSEAHLLFCGGGSCSGWHMNNACDYLKANGVPDEACFPYSHGLSTRSCTPCSDWRNRIDHTKIPSWSNTKDVDQMKTRLVQNGPQITGMAVYTDFFSYAGGVYEPVSGSLEGYHCVAVVGYDDDSGCWICKNSWGTGWGEADGGQRGWFRIKYGECGIDNAFGMWDMEVPTLEGSGEAKYLLVDYSFTTKVRTLWAYAGDAWRHRSITDAEVAGIAKLLMEAGRVHVRWKDGEMTFVRAIK